MSKQPMSGQSMSKQSNSQPYYQASTYRAQDSIGYLVKRTHSLMHDVMEPLLEARGFSFVQYEPQGFLRTVPAR